MEFHVEILPGQSVEHGLALGRLAQELGLAGVWVADSHSVMRDANAVLNLRNERIPICDIMPVRALE